MLDHENELVRQATDFIFCIKNPCSCAPAHPFQGLIRSRLTFWPCLSNVSQKRQRERAQQQKKKNKKKKSEKREAALAEAKKGKKKAKKGGKKGGEASKAAPVSGGGSSSPDDDDDDDMDITQLSGRQGGNLTKRIAKAGARQ